MHSMRLFKLMAFGLLAILLAVPQAKASTVLTFHSNAAYNADSALMDAALGTTGYLVDTFETTTLLPGLSITLSGGVPSTTWTSLPSLFDGSFCGSVTLNQSWDGTDTASSSVTNQLASCATGPPEILANLITFNYSPGTRSFGIGLSNFQSPGSVYA